MAIKVQCPTGCTIELASNQAGKIVECPECNSSIRIPRKPDDNHTESKKRAAQIYLAQFVAEPGELNPLPNLNLQPTAKKENQPPAFSVADLAAKPKRSRRKQSDSNEKIAEPQSNPFDFLAPDQPHEKIDAAAALPIEIERNRTIDLEEELVVIEREDEVKPNAARDRIWLARFYAFCLFLVGLANVVPVVVYSIYFRDQLVEQALPRWGFALIFLAILFAVYSIYLLQLADWATLLVVSIFALVTACIYGFLSAGLMFGDANSFMSQALQLPSSYYRMGPIWGGIMFCVLALTSFILGKDALAWHRSTRIRHQNI